eukprot:13783130-Alexandrium_andersonii.AAC.1
MLPSRIWSGRQRPGRHRWCRKASLSPTTPFRRCSKASGPRGTPRGCGAARGIGTRTSSCGVGD